MNGADPSVPSTVLRWLVVALVVIATTYAMHAATSTPLRATPTTTIDPGRLAPTAIEPSTGRPLIAQLTTLWHAILSDDTKLARSVFFPRTAYLRMKRGLIQSPSRDYASRLIFFFNLDLAAYRQRITSGSQPVLLAVRVNRGDASWIAPRHCDNLIGYWHLGGVRFAFRQNGKVQSVAIDSLISWRGVWYVVHLGPNPRVADVGTVDEYRSGLGVVGTPGGC